MITVSIHGPYAATRTSHKHGTREAQFDTIDIMDNAGNVVHFFGEPDFQLPDPDMKQKIIKVYDFMRKQKMLHWQIFVVLTMFYPEQQVVKVIKEHVMEGVDVECG